MEERVKEIIDKSLVLTTFISTLLCFGIMSVANQFVPLFYGKGYEKCVELYAWLLPSCVFLGFANVLRTQYLLPKKRDKQFIVSLFVGAIVNIVLNSILIKLHASIGAAIATLAAEASVCIVQMIFTWEELKIGIELIKVLPFVVVGYSMYFLFNMQIIDAGGRIISLFLKVIECGLYYFICLGGFLGIYTVVTKVKCKLIK